MASKIKYIPFFVNKKNNKRFLCDKMNHYIGPNPVNVVQEGIFLVEEVEEYSRYTGWLTVKIKRYWLPNEEYTTQIKFTGETGYCNRGTSYQVYLVGLGVHSYVNSFDLTEYLVNPKLLDQPFNIKFRKAGDTFIMDISQ